MTLVYGLEYGRLATFTKSPQIIQTRPTTKSPQCKQTRPTFLWVALYSSCWLHLIIDRIAFKVYARLCMLWSRTLVSKGRDRSMLYVYSMMLIWHRAIIDFYIAKHYLTLFI